MNTPLVTLLEKLLSYASITPVDSGCQEFMIEFLEELGFSCQRFNNPPVSNFFARYGSSSPLFVFAGHTDVVPIGEEGAWHTDPFKLTMKDGIAYGRGAADMKGSLAAMMQSVASFIRDWPDFEGSIGFLITSGEEGDLFNLGTPYLMEQLYKQKNFHIDFCIVGEPSSTKSIADTIKIGRRGSLSGRLTLEGKQGHVAYPHLASNPIHMISEVLTKLTRTSWDEGNAYFPATSFQVTHISAGGEAENVIPGKLSLDFNFRFSTEQTANGLQAKVEHLFATHNLKPCIKWTCNGEPFLTAKGPLLSKTIAEISKITTHSPELSTSGGTSDARFIAPYKTEVIELGPINKTIHQINECVAVEDLEVLTKLYYAILQALLTR